MRFNQMISSVLFVWFKCLINANKPYFCVFFYLAASELLMKYPFNIYHFIFEKKKIIQDPYFRSWPIHIDNFCIRPISFSRSTQTTEMNIWKDIKIQDNEWKSLEKSLDVVCRWKWTYALLCIQQTSTYVSMRNT